MSFSPEVEQSKSSKERNKETREGNRETKNKRKGWRERRMPANAIVSLKYQPVGE